eukprot:1176216-Pleurochrysis_carterae.AAC.1
MLPYCRWHVLAAVRCRQLQCAGAGHTQDGALSGRGARASWLELSAMDDATGGMRRVGTMAFALGRRSAA